MQPVNGGVGVDEGRAHHLGHFAAHDHEAHPWQAEDGLLTAGGQHVDALRPHVNGHVADGLDGGNGEMPAWFR